jgi:MFS family permease
MKIPITITVCPYCGKQVFEAKKEGKWSLIGGILCVISGIIGIILGAVLLGMFALASTASGDDEAEFFIAAGTLVGVCGAVLLVPAILAILGGIFAIKRRKFGLALVGGIFAIFCGGILGIIGLIFIIIGGEEFT